MSLRGTQLLECKEHKGPVSGNKRDGEKRKALGRGFLKGHTHSVKSVATGRGTVPCGGCRVPRPEPTHMTALN